jgi:hypothetical protein
MPILSQTPSERILNLINLYNITTILSYKIGGFPCHHLIIQKKLCPFLVVLPISRQFCDVADPLTG